MRVTFLLCDSAQVANGKLFVLGGGWNIYTKGSPEPLPMALGIVITVPWNETNQRHTFVGELLTEDGGAVMNADASPVRVDGEFEVGRPPGIRPGSDINVPLAVNLGVDIAAGGYRWQVSVDGTVLAEARFDVIAPQIARRS